MKRIVILLAGLVLVQESFALPPCSKDQTQRFHNCYGTATTPSGAKYAGEWKNDKKHGQGTLTSADGAKYVGGWKDDKFHGQGAYTYADGAKYIGGWKDGSIHGQGTYIYADGAKYVGEFKDGNKHGQGTNTWSSGSKYVGEWQNNDFNGQGTIYAANGFAVLEQGTFKNGELVRSHQVAVFPPCPEGQNVVWYNCFGGAEYDGAGSIVALADGSFAVAGKTDFKGARDEDMWVLRLTGAPEQAIVGAP